MSATIFNVTDWLLGKEPMTHKKLQKLAYYYKAWGLALYDKDLIPCYEFMAWVHGPVNRELYDKYHDMGWNDIVIDPDCIRYEFCDKEEELLESIWLTYGDKSANELEALTHKEAPWIKARNGIGEWDRCETIISHEDMKQYYRSIYESVQGD